MERRFEKGGGRVQQAKAREQQLHESLPGCGTPEEILSRDGLPASLRKAVLEPALWQASADRHQPAARAGSTGQQRHVPTAAAAVAAEPAGGLREARGLAMREWPGPARKSGSIGRSLFHGVPRRPSHVQTRLGGLEYQHAYGSLGIASTCQLGKSGKLLFNSLVSSMALSTEFRYASSLKYLREVVCEKKSIKSVFEEPGTSLARKPLVSKKDSMQVPFMVLIDRLVLTGSPC